MRLKELLNESMPDKRIDLQKSSFNIIGDIAIISLPPLAGDIKKDIAKAIMYNSRNIKTVLNKISKVEGERRVACFEVLAGSSTVTVHKEFGYAYRFDVCKVFFNSRLSYERMRVSSLVKEGEKVLIPFCGVGPFAVPIAAKGAQVLVLEMNQEACRWLAENARSNGVDDSISILIGDAFSLPNLIKAMFDRAVIPAPYGKDEILLKISPLVKDGGMIHFYTFKKQYQIEGLIADYEKAGFEISSYRKCGNVAPGASRWVFDLVKAKYQ